MSESGRIEAFLEIVDVITRETRRTELPPSADSRRDLDWSADGRLFAFTACPSGDPETSRLWTLRSSDGSGRALTDGRTWVRSPHWAPDRSYLDFVSNRDGTADLWRLPLNGSGDPAGEPLPISSGLELREARFSPDGSKLALSRGRWVSNVWRVPLLADRPATWQDAEQVTFDEAFVEFVDVSPDGQRVAFSSDRAGNQDLWTMPAEGGNADPVRLTADDAPEWSPRWSHDGKRIAFYSLRSGSRQVWVMPAEGGAATRITRSDAEDVTPVWSPDGTRLAFWSDRTGSNEIWVSPLDGGPARQVTDEPADDYMPSWSPDGRWLAYHSNRDGATRIWRVPSEDGTPEALSRHPGMTAAWSRDGSRVYYVGLGESTGEPEDLWAVSVGDRTERPMTELRGRRGRLGRTGLSADDRFLYFTWRTDRSDLWVMDSAAG